MFDHSVQIGWKPWWLMAGKITPINLPSQLPSLLTACLPRWPKGYRTTQVEPMARPISYLEFDSLPPKLPPQCSALPPFAEQHVFCMSPPFGYGEQCKRQRAGGHVYRATSNITTANRSLRSVGRPASKSLFIAIAVPGRLPDSGETGVCLP